MYIFTWRGLAALLILAWRQCEGLNSGMGESRNSHAFFISKRILFTNAEFGSRKHKKNYYEKKRNCYCFDGNFYLC